MTMRFSLRLFFFTALGVFVSAAQAEEKQKSIRALLVTGGCCHNYKYQSKALIAGVAKDAKVDWKVVNEGGTGTRAKIALYDNPNWAKGFDVVVHNECFANTADAMWGYPGSRGAHYWQWAGKWAARADDVLSWLPARITALLVAALHGGLPARALAKEARKTPSPNSGWPMAAMALALGVRLAKPGVYTLHPGGHAPGPLHTQRAAAYGQKVVLALIPSALAALVLIAMVGG